MDGRIERRSGTSRRDSDKRMDIFEAELDDMHAEIIAMRFILTGHRDAPATGVVRQIMDIENRVRWMIRTNVAAIIAVCGAAVGDILK